MTREEMDAAIAAIDSYVERFPQELVAALWEARAWIELVTQDGVIVDGHHRWQIAQSSKLSDWWAAS